MGKIILILLGALIVMIGVTMLYDARRIATKNFSSEEINETTKILKISGIIIALVGLGIIYIIK
jgi:uncharacterized protein YjeT (DUF2065 family)